MVYSPDQVKLKYVVVFNMEGDRRWPCSYEVDMDQVISSPCPQAEGESIKCEPFNELRNE